MFVGYKNSVGSRSYDNIFKSHADYGNIKVVYRGGVYALTCKDNVSEAFGIHGFRHGVPGSYILPLSAESENSDTVFFFQNGNIKTYFLNGRISCKEIFVSFISDKLLRNLKDVTRSYTEYSGIPECSFFDKSFGIGLRRFFFEIGYGAYLLFFLRDNVSVFGGRECGIDSEKSYALFLRYHFLQFSKCLEIIILYIRIDGTDYHGFIR